MVFTTFLKMVITAAGAGTLATIVVSTMNAKQTRKNQFIQTMIQNRQLWCEKIRQEAAEFCKIAYAIASHPTDESPNLDRLRELEALLQLRMDDFNLACSQEIVANTHIVAELLNKNSKNQKELFKTLEKLKCCIRQYLKHSWETAKEEAQTGESKPKPRNCECYLDKF